MNTPRMITAALAASALALVPFAGAHAEDKPYTLAIIGDVPYGQNQVELYPSWIADINADTDIDTVVHLGDTKSGGDKCTDEWNQMILDRFNDFNKPVVYTPGDNEWTDCHRTSNGSYNPLERLEAIKSLYFPTAGETMGKERLTLTSQDGQRENVRWDADGVTFATAHIVGSNNGKLPWSGLGETEETPEQKAERTARTDAAVEWIFETFWKAKKNDSRAVVLNIHADMFYKNSPSTKYASEFRPIVCALALAANAYGKPVYLINGDSHAWNVDKPLAFGTPWTSFYGAMHAPNITRVIVDGSSNATNWMKLTVNPEGSDDVVTWEQVPFTNPVN